MSALAEQHTERVICMPWAGSWCTPQTHGAQEYLCPNQMCLPGESTDSTCCWRTRSPVHRVLVVGTGCDTPGLRALSTCTCLVPLMHWHSLHVLAGTAQADIAALTELAQEERLGCLHTHTTRTQWPSIVGLERTQACRAGLRL